MMDGDDIMERSTNKQPVLFNSSANAKSYQQALGLSQHTLVMKRGSSAVGTWRSMPVLIKKIGTKKVAVTSDLRREIFNMRELRHPKLVEFVGVCLAAPNICVVTGRGFDL
jgi:hypothetical protein